MQQDQSKKKDMKELEFFTEYEDTNRYKFLEVIGKGSFGVVCAAIDTHTGEKVAIKKIHNVFEHICDAVRVLREVKLLRLLRHPDIVEIKRIMLPPSKRDFKDIYVVFELMESDLHKVITANDDLTQERLQFFVYQMLCALKYMHSANVYHRDLKPKNILANTNCKLKLCDLGHARVKFSDEPLFVYWTDYVATRWYRAPELCGSFSSKYTPAVDIWSIGCIFAELLRGKALFPGKNIMHQLVLITDLLGTPSPEIIQGVRNKRVRKCLMEMKKKLPVPFENKFPNADPLALRLLQRLLAFDPKDRPTAEEALADPFFKSLANVDKEPSCPPISKLDFEFERRQMGMKDVRELIYREILEYHPQMLKYYQSGTEGTNFLYRSAIDQFKKQFAYLEENQGKSGPVTPPGRKHVSLPDTQPSFPPYENKQIAEEPNSGSHLTDLQPLQTVLTGLVSPNDERNIKDTYDSSIPYQKSLPHCLHKVHPANPKTTEHYKDVPSEQCNAPTRTAAFVDHDINPYQQQEGMNGDLNDPVTAIAVAAHMKPAGGFQCGMSG